MKKKTFYYWIVGEGSSNIRVGNQSLSDVTAEIKYNLSKFSHKYCSVSRHTDLRSYCIISTWQVVALG